MKFKYNEIELSKNVELNIQIIHEHKESIINELNIQVIDSIESKIYQNINPNDIILIAETPDEAILLAKDYTKSISSNTNMHIDIENPKINSNLDSEANDESFIWANKISGEIFICTDDTRDKNVWVGQLGTMIKPTGSWTITDGLIVHYEMNDINGNKMPDHSGRFDARIKNCKIEDGKVSECLKFTGNSRAEVLGEPDGLDGPIEFNFWIKPSTFNYRQNLLSKSYAGEFSAVLETNGTISFLFGDNADESNSAGHYNKFGTSQPINLNEWTHISIQRVNYNMVNFFYGNLEIAEITPLLQINSISKSDSKFLIGDGYAGGYRGLMDDFFAHTRNLTKDERQYLISRGGV